MAPYRESLSRLLAGTELSGAPYYLLTYASLALFYFVAMHSGSIWVPLQFVGATAGVLLGERLQGQRGGWRRWWWSGCVQWCGVHCIDHCAANGPERAGRGEAKCCVHLRACRPADLLPLCQSQCRRAHRVHLPRLDCPARHLLPGPNCACLSGG